MNKKNPDDVDKMLTKTEVGRRLGVSNHTVAKLIRAGTLHGFAPGPGMPERVWESELKRFRDAVR